MMYGICDCDNCYVSAELVFRPDLKGTPVVVLSNNDGCVVARSNEAKALGIKAGTPYFQLAKLFPNQKIAVFSSNYELYGELTGRVVSIIRQEVPAYFRYSIDECFVYLDSMEHLDLKKWGEDLHKKIRQYVGMPVSIGLAPNKTLAKMASHFAKKYQGYRHCCMIDSDEKRIKALKLYPIDEVWGIGRRYAAKLNALGVKTAYDFAQHPYPPGCPAGRRKWDENEGPPSTCRPGPPDTDPGRSWPCTPRRCPCPGQRNRAPCRRRTAIRHPDGWRPSSNPPSPAPAANAAPDPGDTLPRTPAGWKWPRCSRWA